MKNRKTLVLIGDDGEPLAKCPRCLAFYSPNYAKTMSRHECYKFILNLVKMRKK